MYPTPKPWSAGPRPNAGQARTGRQRQGRIWRARPISPAASLRASACRSVSQGGVGQTLDLGQWWEPTAKHSIHLSPNCPNRPLLKIQITAVIHRPGRPLPLTRKHPSPCHYLHNLSSLLPNCLQLRPWRPIATAAAFTGSGDRFKLAFGEGGRPAASYSTFWHSAVPPTGLDVARHW
jgi:hypothetical protein